VITAIVTGDGVTKPAEFHRKRFTGPSAVGWLLNGVTIASRADAVFGRLSRETDDDFKRSGEDHQSEGDQKGSSRATAAKPLGCKARASRRCLRGGRPTILQDKGQPPRQYYLSELQPS
jgi:hypothetical protein